MQIVLTETLKKSIISIFPLGHPLKMIVPEIIKIQVRILFLPRFQDGTGSYFHSN